MSDRLKQKQVILTQGFIGSDDAGTTTTLGKEGSDFTGAILASTLDARSLTIWKDVPGIMNADPKLTKQAIKLDYIPYQTMAKMAFYGAKVIHPNTIQPLAALGIPLYVKPFHQLHERGTEITNGLTQVKHPIYILQKNQGLVQLIVDDLTFLDEAHLAEVFQQLADKNIRANMIEKSACTLSICLDTDNYNLNAWLSIQAKKFRITYYPQVSLLTVIHQVNKLPKRGLPQQKLSLIHI